MVFFDGECVMCNGIVVWLSQNSKELHFSSLQGQLFAEKGSGINIDSLVFMDEAEMYIKSDAIFAILKYVPSYSFFRIFKFLPRFARDTVYDFIAKRRKKRTDSCPIPPAGLRQKLLP